MSPTMSPVKSAKSKTSGTKIDLVQCLLLVQQLDLHMKNVLKSILRKVVQNGDQYIVM